MKFQEWIDREGLTDAEVAAAIGIDRTNVYRIRIGAQRPRSAETFRRIAALTKGEVLPDSFFNLGLSE